MIDDNVMEIFTALKKFFNAPGVIAGGYLRDKTFDKPWKDADMFFSVPSLGDRFDTGLAIYKACKGFTSLFDNTHGAEYTLNDIKGIYDGVYKGTQVNIVCVTWDDPADYVKKSFDFGINQIWHDGEKLGCTNQFLTDAALEQVSCTYVSRVWSRDRVSKRQQKISQKLGFTPIEPDWVLLDKITKANMDVPTVTSRAINWELFEWR